jgi:hypothetical protein
MVKPKYLPKPTQCQNASCRVVFLPKREWQRFCKVSCRRQAWMNKRNQVLAKIKVLVEEIQETCNELMRQRET